MMSPTNDSNRTYTEKGQGLVEYALILMFAGLAVYVIASLLGPQISETFSSFVRQAPVAPPALMAYTPPPTLTPTPTPNPNLCHTLTFNASPNNGGTVNVSPSPDCAGNKYRDGTEVTLSALPEDTYQFGSWSGAVSGAHPSITLKMDGDKNVTATFSQFCYTVTTIISPNSSGLIAADPAPNCGSDKYTVGTDVTFSALSAVGYQFVDWADDVSGTNADVTITMDDNKRVSANFEPLCYTMTTAVSPENSGTINIGTDPNCDGDKYTHGTIMVLTVTGIGGNQFTHWSGDASGTSSSATFTMDGNKNVTANFSQVCYTLTTNVSPSNGGTVNISPEPNCGETQYTEDTEVVFTANPGTGHEFSNWSGNASGTNISTAVTMDGDKTVTANFSPLCYTLTTNVSPDNSGTVSTSPAPNCNNGSQFTYGTNVLLTANAESTHDFLEWTGNSDCSDGSITINNDVSCTAVFTPVCSLPSPWQTDDIGNVDAEGTACEDNGTFTIEGSGRDIWNESDEFRYVYQQYSGDFSIITYVTSQENTNSWAKAGVMIRESLAPNSKHATAIVTPRNGVGLQYRDTTGGSSSHTSDSGSAAVWLKLERSGDTFTAYKSSNGSTWTDFASTTVTMGNNVYYGLVVTSHNDGTLSTATFTDVELVRPIVKLIDADFNSSNNNFTYSDDIFGTSNANKADGAHGDYGKDSTDGLRVRLAKDSKSNNPMSGGWTHDLPLSEASELSISFDYRLQTTGLDSGQSECGKITIEIRNASGTAVVSETVREQCNTSDSSWQEYTLDTTQLPAGDYDFIIGAYLTKASKNSEYVYARFDNVLVKTR